MHSTDIMIGYVYEGRKGLDRAVVGLRRGDDEHGTIVEYMTVHHEKLDCKKKQCTLKTFAYWTVRNSGSLTSLRRRHQTKTQPNESQGELFASNQQALQQDFSRLVQELEKQRDEAQKQRDEAQKQRDEAQKQRDEAQKQRDEALRGRDAATQELERLRALHEVMLTDLASMGDKIVDFVRRFSSCPAE